MNHCINPSPFASPQGMPIQALGAKGIRGTMAEFPEYLEGLDDLDGYSQEILAKLSGNLRLRHLVRDGAEGFGHR